MIVQDKIHKTNYEGTMLDFQTENPVLESGGVGAEIDTGKYKFGDGVTAWNDLPYATQKTVENNNPNRE